MNKPTFTKELALWNEGFTMIAGIDEVGRGAWAGPIVAAGVIFEKRVLIPGVRDSKLLSPQKRERLAEIIKEKALAWTIQKIDPQDIDNGGVGKANSRVIELVAEALNPDYLLIDKATINPQNFSMKWETIVRGDSSVFSIAAASILAKVARDTMMVELAADYPQYGFDAHKGYGTRDHRRALKKHSPCPQHRHSYQPIAALLHN